MYLILIADHVGVPAVTVVLAMINCPARTVVVVNDVVLVPFIPQPNEAKMTESIARLAVDVAR